jgi:hypothetical protein
MSTPRNQNKRRGRPMAVAAAHYVGMFAWCEYWRMWDEILECHVDAHGLSHWGVRKVGTQEVRWHCTATPVDCIFGAPVIVNGRHQPPAVRRQAGFGAHATA